MCSAHSYPHPCLDLLQTEGLASHFHKRSTEAKLEDVRGFKLRASVSRGRPRSHGWAVGWHTQKVQAG